ncbi:MAG: xanthine phosphoribosyltransferase [Alishewanella agri]|jgi:xanthine phosphoribosyltransferase|uniref:Xanthine-guanine phosphoribosyltransferase n=3 Tax=Alishewanella TaxID=111142 RepID=I9DT13_9ALTE|nr:MULTISPECIES: xanthine phosphoribosyltransferase [Alishewanella]MDD4862659.1 xanthine phosphoribosyltransferase [Alishewanella agri]OZB36369.1 MAG: xanthine phosphoribosyltransferase [Alishewanella sp. 34-51-39]EHR40036.1 xanthine-guanine phosphoribosyltransferase [Alishewanella jeotgali KCTC 22429]EIW89235.1 xanthine-guanine phosphoribosyltransferase [Alishewanella agri BL06]EJI86271.1 xanthine-guanine phosphoribosyltransferase [Alishewanella aestuarii B11]
MSLTTNKMFYVSWEAFHRATKELARQLLGQNFTAIVAVSRGGLVPAAIIARELNIRVLDSICVASYQHDKQGSLSVLKDASLADSEQLLIVDDLVDTGETAKALRERFPKARFVTVYAKPQGKPLVDNYVTDIEQDTWIQLPWDMELAYSKPLAEEV